MLHMTVKWKLKGGRFCLSIQKESADNSVLTSLCLSPIKYSSTFLYGSESMVSRVRQLQEKEETFGMIFQSLPESLPVSKVKVIQSCPTHCNPMDYTVREILQSRILE